MAVYFARAGDLVKIGHAVDVPKRIHTLQCGHPLPLTVVREIPGGRGVERAFHRHFSHLAARGEWFNWSDEMLTAEVEASPGRSLPPAPAAHLDALNILSAQCGSDGQAAKLLRVSPQVFGNWRKRGISTAKCNAVWLAVNKSPGRDWLFISSHSHASIPVALRSAA